MTLDFFKRKYGYEIDGVWFPRVTTITSSVREGWPGLRRAAEWGTSVHEAIEGILRGESVLYEPRLAVTIKTFVEWQNAFPIKIRDPQNDIEFRVVDLEHGYAGTVDVVAEVDGVLGIVDLKTSTAIVREHALQTAAYLNAYNAMRENHEKCKTRWILRVDQYQQCVGCLAKKREKYGRARVAGQSANWRACNHQWSDLKGEVEFRELAAYEKDLEAFFALKERWEWANKEWLGKIPNYEKSIRPVELP